MKNFDSLTKLVGDHPTCRLSVAVAEDHTVLEAVRDAESHGPVEATLFGDRDQILEAAEQAEFAPTEDRVVHEPDPVKAALAQMCDRRQFSVPCQVDGPFAPDNAISELAAKHKKISGPRMHSRSALKPM